jgi:hypothetical protein
MAPRITAPVAPACLDMAIQLLITGIRPILVTGIAHTRSGVGGGEIDRPMFASNLPHRLTQSYSFSLVMSISFTKHLAMLFAAFIVCACAAKRDPMKTTLDAWVGRSIGEYADQRGLPTNTIDLGPGRSAFQWVTGEVKPSAISPTGGNTITVPPSASSCLTSLVATTTKPNPSLADWTIESWTLNGNC